MIRQGEKMDKKKDKKTSIDSLEALTDVEIDYPLVYKDGIGPLGGRNTTEERYPVSEMVDDE
ncbi:MAG: hypothetical protein APF77_14790 [Clostridia bacterium BRH_c25]|nr:MAG: hypothetical protein APF77_14790 [Clostridia bacterium BRH_c25]